MSEDFVTRWSRRKQAVREAEAEPSSPGTGEVESARSAEPGEGPYSEPVSTTLTGSPSPSRPLPSQGSEEVAPAPGAAEPLPRIEDITAASDVSAFLRQGVPEALRNAALRRAWSLDPVIRDFVGPAEYAWDYNNPGSMAGFGALTEAVKLQHAFSRPPGSTPDPPEQSLAAKEPMPGPASPPSSAAAEHVERAVPPAVSQDALAEAESSSGHDRIPETGPELALAETGPEPSEAEQIGEQPYAVPRHGSAAPR
jgi:hypothetical protein